MIFLKQACAGHRPVRACFCKIDPVRIVSIYMRVCLHVCVRVCVCMCVCVCVCPRP